MIPLLAREVCRGGTAWGGILVFLVSLQAAAQPTVARARIDLSGIKDGIRLMVAAVPDGGTGQVATWQQPPENNTRYLTFEMPAVRDTWRPMSFSFMPLKGGNVEISLRGMYWREGEAIQRIWVLYDDVTVEGAELVNGDFETVESKRPVGWTLGRKDDFSAILVADPKRVRAGKGAIEVAHDQSATQTIRVEADRIVRITAWQRLSEMP